MRLKTYKMAMSILPKFLILKWNILRTIWRLEVGDGSFSCIFHALSFELNLLFDRRCPLSLVSIKLIMTKTTTNFESKQSDWAIPLFSIQGCGTFLNSFLGMRKQEFQGRWHQKSPLGNQFSWYDPSGKLTPTSFNRHNPSGNLSWPPRKGNFSLCLPWKTLLAHPQGVCLPHPCMDKRWNSPLA